MDQLLAIPTRAEFAIHARVYMFSNDLEKEYKLRTRAWRRAMTERYKAKQLRDFNNHHRTSWAIAYMPKFFSDTRHHYDCGKTCYMCHGDKLLDGHTRDRQEAQRAILNETFEASRVNAD